MTRDENLWQASFEALGQPGKAMSHARINEFCKFTHGTKTGTILRCIFRHENVGTPRFEGRASVTSDGFVMANFIDSDGRGHWGAFVGGLAEVTTNVMQAGRQFKLTPPEQAHLASELRAWWSGNDWRC